MIKKHAHASRNKKVFSAVIILVGLLAAVVIVWYACLAVIAHQNQARLDRIVAIYDSIKVDGQVYFPEDNVFGDKRPYEADKSRTYSSSKAFTVPKNVDATVTELDASIKKAGFKALKDPYPGSVIIEKHYKSDKGEYVRLTVSSKPRDEIGQNDILMRKEFSEAYFAADPNAGPSAVILKVNLDDNNE